MTPNRAQPLPAISRKSKELSMAEISAILNFIDSPCLLIESVGGGIQSANAGFLELTGYTLGELIGKPAYSIFLSPNPLDVSEELDWGEILRRDSGTTAVKIEKKVLDNDGYWILLSLVPEKKLDQVSEVDSHILIQSIEDLADLVNYSTLEEALEKAVRVASKILNSELVAIYQADGQYPHLIRRAVLDESEVFPPQLAADEMVKLSQLTIWRSGKRIQTQLHRQARIANLAGMISCPLGEKGAPIGMLVVGYQESLDYEAFAVKLEMTATLIGNALQHIILVGNLVDESDNNNRLNTIRDTMIENTLEGILVLTPEGLIQDINPAAEVMLGYARWEVHDQPIENVVIGEDGLGPALQSVSTGVPAINIQNASLHRRNGQAFPAHIQIAPVMQDRKVVSVIVYLTDNSENEQNRIRTQQLEQRAFLGDISAVFAHEVRNPINNIQASLVYLCSTLGPDDPKQDTIARMQSDVTRLTHLMDSILACARPMEPKFELLDLCSFVSRLVDRWRPRMSRLNIECYFQAEEALPKVMGDPRTLDQVFTNLISNALDAMTDKGGFLGVKIQQQIVGSRRMVRVSISDTGPGIPSEVIERIFEPFVTTKPSGTGLGLAISKQIITAHHGTLNFETYPTGTIFFVDIPARNGENR